MVGGEGVPALGEQARRWDREEVHAELSSGLAVGMRGREGQEHSFKAADSLVCYPEILAPYYSLLPSVSPSPWLTLHLYPFSCTWFRWEPGPKVLGPHQAL